MRASLYVRLSNAAGAVNMSKQGMIDDLRALCKREGLTEVALHVDDGLSGAVRDRPAFLAWLADGREGRADALVTWHCDRLTREGVNVAALILDVAEGKDTRTGRVVRPPVRLLDTGGLDSADGDAYRFRFVIDAEVGRSERARIVARNKAKTERLRHAGRFAGGTVPYGYRPVPAPDGRGKVLDVAQDEAEVVQDAAQLILTGHSLGRVCRYLNADGRRPRKGGEWTRTSLFQVLTGTAVTGAVTHGGKVLRDDEGRLFTPFPAVLDLPTALAVRAALAPKDERVHTGRHPARLLSGGIITCASCGHPLRVSTRTTRVTTYRCITRTFGGTCAHPATVNAEAVEAYVSERFVSELGHAPTYRERVVVTGAANLADLDDRIAATLAELGTAATPEAFAQLQRLQAERAEAERAPRETHVERVPTGRSLAEEWRRRDVEGRRELLADAVGVLVLHQGQRGRRFGPERVTLLWAEGEHDPD